MISVKLDVASVVDSRGGVHEYDGQIVSTWVAAKEDREILLCTSDIQKDGPRGSSDGEFGASSFFLCWQRGFNPSDSKSPKHFFLPPLFLSYVIWKTTV